MTVHADAVIIGIGPGGEDVVRKLAEAALPPEWESRRNWSGECPYRDQFTHVAMYQAAIAVADILAEDIPPADYRALPRVTFTNPEVGAAGLAEAQARKQGLPIRTGTAQVPSSARGWIHEPGNDGFIKLVEDSDKGVLVGATTAGPRGGDVLSMLALAIQARIPTQALWHMIYGLPDLLSRHRRRPSACAGSVVVGRGVATQA